MGRMLFIGGVAGLVVSFVICITILVYLKRERKRIQNNLEKNYG